MPAPGSFLMEPKVTFRWTFTEAIGHWLVLTSGDSLLFNGSTDGGDGPFVNLKEKRFFLAHWSEQLNAKLHDAPRESEGANQPD